MIEQENAPEMKGERYYPSAEFISKSRVKSMQEYQALYERSINDPEGFWMEMAEDLTWIKRWDKVMDCDFREARIRWFEGGRLNVSANCLDRHLETWRKNKAALIWQGEPSDELQVFTYQTLFQEVNKFANVLKKKGVGKGDRVVIYLPMIPQLPIAMLACARIGAIHSVVFGGFSAEALRDRIIDCGAVFLITSDGSFRSGRIIPLKENADQALVGNEDLKTVIVVKRTNEPVEMVEGRDVWYHDEMAAEDIRDICKPEVMDAEDPLFILYTSGSTGKPKGVLHSSAGYLLYALETFKYIFDYRDEDTYWCTADIGWVTGHSYILYGPLAAGATSIMFEGVPTYPRPDRFWEIVQKHGVNSFYTAPTAIRAMAREGNSWPESHDLSSLRLLGTVGEPINPEAWQWYYNVIGGAKCPIVDTWWQTETGGILISALPGAVPIKPGSVTLPFFGIKPKIVRDDGTECEVNESGYLVIEKAWPGMMRGVFNQPDRFREAYFKQVPGCYFSGDGARKDKDGYIWVMGRIDDVINVSGHRLGTAEIESALVAHEKVAEAAVVGYSHDIKGQGIYAFVTLNAGAPKSNELQEALRLHVRKLIGPIATPDKIQFADKLPKTRSGKIMRRILKKIVAGEHDQLGDTSTLAEPDVVDELIKGKM